MAEARQAVTPAQTLLRAGYEVDTSSREMQINFSSAGMVLYIPGPRFLLRSARRSMWRSITRMQLAFSPAPLWSVVMFATAFAAFVSYRPSDSWFRSGAPARLLWKLDSLVPWAEKFTTQVRVMNLASLTALGAAYVNAAGQRFVLRRLLAYTDWLHNRKSLKTKIWAMTVKYGYLKRYGRQMFAFQTSLPTLSLPSVAETCPRYFETVEPLMNAEEAKVHREEMNEFIRHTAPPLQRRLWLKWLISRNYVSDWWKQLVYLRSRESLFINSNWYGIQYATYTVSTDQAARAAVTTYHMVKIKRSIENEVFEPQVAGGLTPLCMSQYSSIFNTTRVPGAEQDTLVTFDRSSHIAVICRGKIYKLPVFSERSRDQLSPLQLYAAFRGILGLSSENSPVADSSMPSISQDLPALTSMNRTQWAEIRAQHFVCHSHNKLRLEAVEEAIFVLCLDDVEIPSGDLTAEGRLYMCGNGANRWGDKSVNIIITKNGRMGVHVEHSFGDAPCMAHLIELMTVDDCEHRFYSKETGVAELPEDKEKIGKLGYLPTYPAQLLDFEVNPELAALASEARRSFEERIDNFLLHIGTFTDYGKKYISHKASLSPDAWCQMALQLAYYRDQKSLELTYESAMTRLFLDGRTETIRSLSKQSKAFVLAFDDPKVDPAQKLKLLQEACDHHQEYSYYAMEGKGVDRHLFALYVVSVYLGVESPFLKTALGRKFKLSTSQVPSAQVLNKDLSKRVKITGCPREFESPMGGFGPVVDTGYGVCYNIWNETLYFNVSGCRCDGSTTDPKRFYSVVQRCLREMKELVESQNKQ